MIKQNIIIHSFKVVYSTIVVLAFLASCADDTVSMIEDDSKMETERTPIIISPNISSTPYYNIEVSEISETRAANYKRNTDILKERGKMLVMAILQDDYNSIVPGQPDTYSQNLDHRYGQEVSPYYHPTTTYLYNNTIMAWAPEDMLYYPYGKKSSNPELEDTKTAVIGLSPTPADFNPNSIISTTLSVKKDQSTIDNVKKCDLLIGELTDLNKSQDVVALEMKHAFSILTFETNYQILKNSAPYNAVEIYIDSVATEGLCRIAGYNKYNASTSVSDCPYTFFTGIDSTFIYHEDEFDEYGEQIIDTILTDHYEKGNAAEFLPKDTVLIYSKEIDTEANPYSLDRLTAIVLPTNVPQMKFRIRIYGGDLYPTYDEGERSVGYDEVKGMYIEYHLKPTRTNQEKTVLEPGRRYKFCFSYGYYIPMPDPDDMDPDDIIDDFESIKVTKGQADDDMPILTKKNSFVLE